MAEEGLSSHILVVDDDARLRDLLRRFLAEQGFIVTAAANAAAARAELAWIKPDLVVLDVMMPGEDGVSFARSLRAGEPTRALPILLLTARGEAEDRIAGLSAGADDYLPKPFEPRELILRIQAILRRVLPKAEAAHRLRFGTWNFDLRRDELVGADGADPQRLTAIEGNLLRFLAATPGIPVSREAICRKLYGEAEDQANLRTVDVQITRLRKKLEADSKAPRYLLTVRGEGYMLQPDAQTGAP